MSFISAKGDQGDRAVNAEPGSLENPIEITDPRALRALAHPARIAIMQHMILDGPATATECAGAAGLSPSACSYHLRALAKYGFVAAEPGHAVDQRHRPWRARLVAMSFGEDPDRSGTLRIADRLLLESIQAWTDDLRTSYYDREADYPREWQTAAGSTQAFLHVTAAELTELRAKISGLLAGYVRLNPADRPAGARRVHAHAEFTPGFAPPGAPDGTPGSAGARP